MLRDFGDDAVEPYGSPEPQCFPSPFSPDWSNLNRRRATLIGLGSRGRLSSKEADELAWLQKETLAAVDLAFPRPPVDFRYLAELEERLKKGGEPEAR
jgi:hypothetical protein